MCGFKEHTYCRREEKQRARAERIKKMAADERRLEQARLRSRALNVDDALRLLSAPPCRLLVLCGHRCLGGSSKFSACANATDGVRVRCTCGTQFTIGPRTLAEALEWVKRHRVYGGGGGAGGAGVSRAG